MKLDGITTREQQRTIALSGLCAEEQWRLLNVFLPPEVLSLVNSAQNGMKNGLLTAHETNELTKRALWYSEARSQLVSGNASSLPSLQKGLLHGEWVEILAARKKKRILRYVYGNVSRMIRISTLKLQP